MLAPRKASEWPCPPSELGSDSPSAVGVQGTWGWAPTPVRTMHPHSCPVLSPCEPPHHVEGRLRGAAGRSHARLQPHEGREALLLGGHVSPTAALFLPRASSAGSLLGFHAGWVHDLTRSSAPQFGVIFLTFVVCLLCVCGGAHTLGLG